jgi:hypothetical protein
MGLAIAPRAIAVLISGLLIIVGSFLPWISLSAAFVGTISRSGIEGGGDGIVTAVAGGILITLAWRLYTAPKEARPPSIVGCLIGLALLAFLFGLEYPDLSARVAKAQEGGLAVASIGIGFYVMAAGAVLALLNPAIPMQRLSEPDDAPPAQPYWRPCPRCGAWMNWTAARFCGACGLDLVSLPR